ncbi:MAG: hypothetical protein PWR22_1841 [Moorella sp. (in: firmicutes)]|jgi:hypothetical protein|nr:hypothetical protein [Moorella sp. (in: firmicutes)]MDK2894959.1 hypothetical protein [Moorella sp. (in: firmicutes)]
MVLGLLIDCEGRTIGYELFPGNTFDGKTLEAALEKLEKLFGLRQVIIVAERGINSKLNLTGVVVEFQPPVLQEGYKFIPLTAPRYLFHVKGRRSTGRPVFLPTGGALQLLAADLPGSSLDGRALCGAGR